MLDTEDEDLINALMIIGGNATLKIVNYLSIIGMLLKRMISGKSQ
jgi:hypothetical protein